MSGEHEIGMDDLGILDEGMFLCECKRCANSWTEENCQMYNYLCFECFIHDLLEDMPTLPEALTFDEGYVSS